MFSFKKILNKAKTLKYKILGNYKVGDFTLKIPRSSILYQIFIKHPFYTQNIGRIAKIVKSKYKDLSVIDVGANVGDTVAFVRTKIECPILCIEPESFYFKYLKENTKNINDIYLESVFLGEAQEFIEGKTVTVRGTSKISKGEKGSIKIETLDNLLNKYQEFNNSKLLKIDTDGYDNKIIRGAKEYLKRVKPVIFFEYHAQLLEKNGEGRLSVFSFLENLGYEHIIFYENTGEYILSAELKNKNLLEDLQVFLERPSKIPYFDLCVFHKEDKNLYEKFRTEEIKFFQQYKI